MRPKVKCKKPCNIFCYKAFVVLRSQDSNLELPDPESGALPIWPLLNEETNYTIIFLKVITVDEKYPDSVFEFSLEPGIPGAVACIPGSFNDDRGRKTVAGSVLGFNRDPLVKRLFFST